MRPRALVRCAYGWLGRFDAMASPCEVHVADYGRRTAQAVVDAVAAEAWRIEAKWSRYRAGNVVHAINTAAGAPVEVDEETARLIDYAARLFELSDGRFDITSGALRRAWRFDGTDRVPAADTVSAALEHVGWRRVRWESPVLTLEPGMEIDFGGIGKEYAVDRAAEIAGATVGHCLLNFGGDLRALGPCADGRPWQVGIEALEHTGRAARRLELYRGALATSGDARRFLLRGGKRYGHVLDPSTGWPVEDAPRSVTVAAPTCTEAGMLATFALLQGAGAETFLRAQNVAHWCLR